MGDWDDMVEMGYGNPDGTLTDSFYASMEDSVEESERYTEDEYEYIQVELTPSEYLDSEEKYIRARIINNKVNSNWDDFEVLHDKFNEHDKYALDVYYKGTFIGHIRKNKTILPASKINEFCFMGNKLVELNINWSEDSFQLRRTLTYELKRFLEVKKAEEKKRLEEELRQRKLYEEQERKRLEEKKKKEKIQKEQERQAREKQEFKYKVKIGIIFRDTLEITLDSIYWKDKSYTFETITRLAWGITDKGYSIIVGDDSTYMEIGTKRENVYKEVIQRLERAVYPNIMRDIVQKLNKGQGMSFDNATIWDDGITLSTNSWLFSNKEKFKWYEIDIKSTENMYIITAKKNDDYILRLPHLGVFNVRCMLSLIQSVIFSSNIQKISELTLPPKFDLNNTAKSIDKIQKASHQNSSQQKKVQFKNETESKQDSNNQKTMHPFEYKLYKFRQEQANKEKEKKHTIKTKDSFPQVVDTSNANELQKELSKYIDTKKNEGWKLIKNSNTTFEMVKYEKDFILSYFLGWLILLISIITFFSHLIFAFMLIVVIMPIAYFLSFGEKKVVLKGYFDRNRKKIIIDT